MDNDPGAPPSAKKVGKASNAECTFPDLRHIAVLCF
jgi:hypothetical protein